MLNFKFNFYDVLSNSQINLTSSDISDLFTLDDGSIQITDNDGNLYQTKATISIPQGQIVDQFPNLLNAVVASNAPDSIGAKVLESISLKDSLNISSKSIKV